MPGDEVHEEAGATADGVPHQRGRTGPRHAAPRKPLLTRLHVPAGKAIALAAMPSAVLMGMGITPQLANAKPLPKNPFKGDACVSAPDKEETEAEEQDRKDRAEKLRSDLEREQAKRDKGSQSGADGEKSGGSGEADEPAPGSPTEPSGGSGDGDTADEPAPAPSAPGDGGSGEEDEGDSEDEENPWYDPLGVGKKLEEAFKPKEEKEKEKEAPADEETGKPTPEPSSGSGSGDSGKPAAPEEKPEDGKSDSGKGGSGKASGSDGDTASPADEAAKEKAAKEKAARARAKEKAAEKAKEAEDESGVSKKDGRARDFEAAKDGGKPFPCPEKTDVDGTDEQTPAQVPNQPWNLEASSLTLKGLDYEGVVNITMPNGKTKQALKFTADTLDIGDLHQTVKGPNGTTYHVQAAEGSTSTIRGGKVTMYTEELKGNLFGLIPITFSPETPPPINVPFAHFTKVNVKQAGQFGGNLTVPGLHQWVDK